MSQINFDNVSDRCKELLNKMGKKMKMMKDSTEEISKMNELYLEDFLNKNMGYCTHLEVDKDPSLNSKSLKRSSSVTELNPGSSHSLPKIASRKVIKNFDYINDNYRKQLNKAFMLFNPLIHLENIYMLMRADPTIKEDIVNLRKSVDEDLREVTDKHYYRKKYEELMIKNKKRIKKGSFDVSDNDNNDKEATKTSLRKTSTGFIRTKNVQGETKKKYPKREQRLKEMESMLSSVKSMIQLNDEENIRENIDKSLHHHERSKSYYLDENDQIRVKHQEVQDFFKPQKKKVCDNLGNIYLVKLKKNTVDEETMLRNYLKRETTNFPKKISNLKEAFIKEFDAGIVKNKINLPESKKVSV